MGFWGKVRHRKRGRFFCKLILSEQTLKPHWCVPTDYSNGLCPTMAQNAPAPACQVTTPALSQGLLLPGWGLERWASWVCPAVVYFPVNFAHAFWPFVFWLTQAAAIANQSLASREGDAGRTDPALETWKESGKGAQAGTLALNERVPSGVTAEKSTDTPGERRGSSTLSR